MNLEELQSELKKAQHEARAWRSAYDQLAEQVARLAELTEPVLSRHPINAVQAARELVVRFIEQHKRDGEEVRRVRDEMERMLDDVRMAKAEMAALQDVASKNYSDLATMYDLIADAFEKVKELRGHRS